MTLQWSDYAIKTFQEASDYIASNFYPEYADAFDADDVKPMTNYGVCEQRHVIISNRANNNIILRWIGISTQHTIVI